MISRPIWRAVPAMMRKAASSLRAFKSLAFVFTISMTCLRVTLPTFSLFGSFDPAAMFAAFFNKTAAGGLLVMKVNDLSLGGGVKFFAERHDVDAARSERGADGRRGVRLTGWNLELDLSNYFFSH